MAKRRAVDRQSRERLLAAGVVALVAAAIVIVYGNSYSGRFILDDERHIVRNDAIRTLWPPWHLLTGSRRPLVSLSLAVNYRLGGLDEWGYHAFNVGVHVLVACVLFALFRRVLRVGGFLKKAASTSAVAGIIALIWAVHPLQTQSVTYIIQRSESMAGLFYVLVVYCGLRGMESPRGWRWYAAALLCSIFGLACKATVLTAPVVLFVFDAGLVTRSVRASLRRRWWLYAGFMATWAVVVAVGVAGAVLKADGRGTLAVGFGVEGVSPWEYLLTQPAVLLHYLRLVFWPSVLCLDYGWPMARGAGDALLPGLVVMSLLAGTVFLLRRGSWLGIAGAWFFIILAPTSSIVPIRDAAFEHRMYLPSAAVIAVGVGAAFAAMSQLRRRVPAASVVALPAGVIVVVAVVCSLGYLTWRRNEDYHSVQRMWMEIARERPENARAHLNAGIALTNSGHFERAISHYRKALELRPDYSLTHFNLATALAGRGAIGESIRAYRRAVQLNPRFVDARFNLGNALYRQGRLAGALEQFEAVVRLDKRDRAAWIMIGNIHARRGDQAGAEKAFRKALRVRPQVPDARGEARAWFNLGNALLAQQRVEEGIEAYRGAISVQPAYARAYYGLGLALERAGRRGEAMDAYRMALRRDGTLDAARRRLEALGG